MFPCSLKLTIAHERVLIRLITGGKGVFYCEVRTNPQHASEAGEKTCRQGRFLNLFSNITTLTTKIESTTEQNKKLCIITLSLAK